MAQPTTYTPSETDIDGESGTLLLLSRWPHSIDYVLRERRAGVDWATLRERLARLVAVPVML